MGESEATDAGKHRCPCGSAAEGPACAACGWPVETRRPRRLVLPIVLVPLAALLLGIVAIAIPYLVMPTTPAAAVAGALLPRTDPHPAVRDPADLIVQDVAGMETFEPYPEHVDGLTLQEAAYLNEARPDQELTLLEDLKFSTGAIRWWLVPEERLAYVSVFEFADARGADAYATETALAYASDATVTPVWVAAPGAAAYGYSIPDDGWYGYSVHFAKGRRVYSIVMLNLDGRPGNEDLLRDLVREQYVNG